MKLQVKRDSQASWAQEAEPEDNCGYRIQIAGQKGSGKGTTPRPDEKQEEGCLPLQAAVDAHTKSHVLPAAVLQAGASIPRDGGRHFSTGRYWGQRLKSEQIIISALSVIFFPLNKLIVIMKGQKPKVTFLRRRRIQK